MKSLDQILGDEVPDELLIVPHKHTPKRILQQGITGGRCKYQNKRSIMNNKTRKDDKEIAIAHDIQE